MASTDHDEATIDRVRAGHYFIPGAVGGDRR
jgi:hypothetical protein